MTKGWKHDSHEKLVTAGFRRCASTYCPLCARALLIYQHGTDFPVFLNSETFMPHLEVSHIEPLLDMTAEQRAATPTPVDWKRRASGERDE